MGSIFQYCCCIKRIRRLTSEQPVSDHSVSIEYNNSTETVQQQPKLVSKSIANLPLGSRIRFVSKTLYHGASVVWTGIKLNAESKYPGEEVVVASLDEKLAGVTNGTFFGQHPFDAEPNKLYILLYREDIEIIPDVKDGDYCILNKSKGEVSYVGGFAYKTEDHNFRLWPIDADYQNLQLVNSITAPDFILLQTPPEISLDVSEPVRCISIKNLNHFLGRNKGIQGANNSCYLDSILFSLFAFSDSYDYLIFDEQTRRGKWDAISILRYQIIQPLRRHFYVSHNHVGELRQSIARHSGMVEFEDEVRDLQECIETVFGTILDSAPWISLGLLDGEKTHFTQAYSIEVITFEKLPVPTLQRLLNQASVTMNFCLKEMVPRFLLQLPRERHHNTIVLPSLQLDLKDILFRSEKECSLCNDIATYRFGEAVIFGDHSNALFCNSCIETNGFDITKTAQFGNPRRSINQEINTNVYLRALICIDVAHYNAFVSCGFGSNQKWVFFDSMSEQNNLFNPKSNTRETFNIPLVEEVPDFIHWLEEAPKYMEKDGDLDNFFDDIDEANLERCKRIFTCPYLLLYEEDK